MRTELICEKGSLYRDSFKIQGYIFGTGKKSLCIIGNMRGNEYQQIYVCAQLIQAFKEAEKQDLLVPGHEILVIPSANPYSMNIEKRFWPIDNTDINRMFPGYDKGEATQRIADVIFKRIQGYEYGIQLASNYLPGEFMSHINVMKTGFEDLPSAMTFGVPYVILREPRPYDTTTLNYNWQIWETRAFSLYTTGTTRINRESAKKGVEAVFTFMRAQGLILGEANEAPGQSRLVNEGEDIFSIRSEEAGLLDSEVQVGDRVRPGMLLARILNPLDGEVLEQLYAPEGGTVYFVHGGPLAYGHTAVIKIVRDE